MVLEYRTVSAWFGTETNFIFGNSEDELLREYDRIRKEHREQQLIIEFVKIDK